MTALAAPVTASPTADLPNTGTNFSLLAYRYSTGGYLPARRGLHAGRLERGRAAGVVLALAQSSQRQHQPQLGTAATFTERFLARYAAAGGRSTSKSASNRWRDVKLHFRATPAQPVRKLSSGDRPSRLFSLNLSIPLAALDAGHRPEQHARAKQRNPLSGVSGMLGSVARPPTRCRLP